MTNVRDLLLTSIIPGAFLTFYLAHGLLLSGAWTLWGLSPKLGMATGRVRAKFFYTRTRPASLYP